jgi:hypothetical protein
MMALVWVDHDLRCFIFTFVSMQEGARYCLTGWRQADKEYNNASPECVQIEVPIPKVAEIYYKVCGKANQNNCD